MIEKINLEQLEIVSGGSRYCKFSDGKILVCYTGLENSQGMPIPSFWVLYDNWEDAKVDVLNYDRYGIGSFSPAKITTDLRVKRTRLEELVEVA